MVDVKCLKLFGTFGYLGIEELLFSCCIVLS